MLLKSFPGVGAFDHLEWTYNGAFEQLFSLERGEFSKNFRKIQCPGGGGGMFKLRFDWYIKHKRKSLNFCHYVTPIKPRSYSTCHQELFYM